MIKLQKILCPLDFSENSLEALKYAAHTALREDATLYLIHIVDSRVYDYGGPIYEPVIPAMKSKIDPASKERLKDKLLEKVPKEIQDRVEMVITFGVPFVEIIRAARDYDVDLIVMGTQGRTGVSHMLIGSVAERVVRKAPCPVLTVKMPVKKDV